jgi:uncharacterized protein
MSAALVRVQPFIFSKGDNGSIVRIGRASTTPSSFPLVRYERRSPLEERPFSYQGFQSWINEGKLMAVSCTDCGTLFLPPRPMCANCFSIQMQWVKCTGKGKLAGYSIVYGGLPAMITRGYNRERPYVSGIVQLEEGPLINAQIMGENQDHPENLHVDMPLWHAFIQSSSDDAAQASLVFTTSSSPGM